MDFFFVEYRDPIFGLVVLATLVLVVAVAHYAWRVVSSKSQEKGLEGFIKKFEIADEHKDLLRASSLSLENLHFLASIFTKSGEFEKAIQIYLIALEKIKDKNEREAIFCDLAEVYFRAGFLARSEEVLLSALSLRPRNEKALKLLKIVYLRLKRYDEVLQTLDCLFELGFEVSKERDFIEVMRAKNATKSSLNANAPKSVSLSEFRANLNKNSSENSSDFDINSSKKNGANFGVNLNENLGENSRNLNENSSENLNEKSEANLSLNSKNLSENLGENLTQNSSKNLKENSSELLKNSHANSNEILDKNSNKKGKKQSKNSAQSYENNDLVKRFLLENGDTSLHAEFSKVVDLLYKVQTPIFLDDSEYFELFCARGLAAKRQNYDFKNAKLKMLEILNDNGFKAKLGFYYVCKHCKNQMPLFFYHCPICYEFGGCKILYEVEASDEKG